MGAAVCIIYGLWSEKCYYSHHILCIGYEEQKRSEIEENHKAFLTNVDFVFKILKRSVKRSVIFEIEVSLCKLVYDFKQDLNAGKTAFF